MQTTISDPITTTQAGVILGIKSRGVLALAARGRLTSEITDNRELRASGGGPMRLFSRQEVMEFHRSRSAFRAIPPQTPEERAAKANARRRASTARARN